MSAPCAIHVGGGAITLKHNPFGKDVANLAMYRALAQHLPAGDLPFLFNYQVSEAELATALFGQGQPPRRLIPTSVFNYDAMQKAGNMFVGKADLEDLAWLRQQRGEKAWSITGLVHSLAPLAMRAYTARVLTSPLQPWDALICTSPVVRDAVREMLETRSEFLAARFGGGKPAPILQTPLIPLGISLDDFRRDGADPRQRADLRKKLGIDADDFAALWVGRLSFFEKAFPQSMFQAVNDAARETGKTVHLLLVGWFPGGDRDRHLYEEAQKVHAPHVRVHYLDGNDRALVRRVWSAADCFVSLVDNIQETFGITPIEAMAAGLPVVVSDWDGYRFTVQDGVQGFRIPTLTPPPGSGAMINLRHAMGMDSYQRYAANVAMHTAVDVAAARDAFVALIRDPELRKTMGAASVERARTTFDWPVVVAQMVELWNELAQIRASAQSFEGGPLPRFNPAKGEPYHDFRNFPTHSMTGDTRFQRRPEATPQRLEALLAVSLNSSVDMWRMPKGRLVELLTVLGEESLTAGELAARLPGVSPDSLDRTLVWLCKMDLLSWTPGKGEDIP